MTQTDMLKMKVLSSIAQVQKKDKEQVGRMEEGQKGEERIRGFCIMSSGQ